MKFFVFVRFPSVHLKKLFIHTITYIALIYANLDFIFNFTAFGSMYVFSFSTHLLEYQVVSKSLTCPFSRASSGVKVTNVSFNQVSNSVKVTQLSIQKTFTCSYKYNRLRSQYVHSNNDQLKHNKKRCDFK